MLQNTVSSKRVRFVNLSNGKFVLPAEEGAQGAVQRTNKLGREVWEMLYNELYGTISKIEIVKKKPYNETEDQDCLKIVIVDEGEKYVLQSFLTDRTSKEFINQLITVDKNVFGLDVKIKGYNFLAKDGKTVTGYNWHVDGEKLGKFSTKENRNGLPDMKQVKVKGKDTWDDTDQIEFFTAKIKEWLSKQQFPEAKEWVPVSEPVTPGIQIKDQSGQTGEEPPADQTNDLPF